MILPLRSTATFLMILPLRSTTTFLMILPLRSTTTFLMILPLFKTVLKVNEKRIKLKCLRQFVYFQLFSHFILWFYQTFST
jgi:hypothetical protein